MLTRLLQGADDDGDASCANGGFRLSDNFLVAPAAPSESGSFTSCGFAKAVGQAYLGSSSSDDTQSTRISVQSLTVMCLSVRNANPQENIQCDDDNFLMECRMEGPCTGGVDHLSRGKPRGCLHLLSALLSACGRVSQRRCRGSRPQLNRRKKDHI